MIPDEGRLLIEAGTRAAAALEAAAARLEALNRRLERQECGARPQLRLIVTPQSSRN